MKNAPTASQKTKQFSANSRKTHSRSASYGRNLNKLGRIASSEDVVTQRPHLNRSKSSDGFSTRRNRSFTKLSLLQPLQRTKSHQHPTRQDSGSTVILDLHSDGDGTKVNDNNEEEEQDQDQDQDQDQEEEVDNFSDDNDIKEESEQNVQSELAPLSYKAPSQFSHSYVKPGSSFSSESPSKSNSRPQAEQSHLTPLANGDADRKKSLIDSEKLSQITKDLRLNEQARAPPSASAHHGKEPSKEELAQYYQNMILSQSTGVVRNFSDQPFQNSLLPENLQHLKNSDNLPYIHSNDHISGTLSSLRQIGTSSNSLRQFTINNPNSKISSSHDSSSIISFKVEPGMRMTTIQKTQSKESVPGTPNNFSTFLRSNNSNIETRTQKKLWLQRENSLLDFTAVNASNNQASNPAIRREFERISREYVNNRRFENPLLESVKRINLEKIANSGAPPIKDSPRNTAENVMSDSIQKKLQKLWEQGTKPEFKPSYVNHHQPNHLHQYHQNQRMHHVQQHYNQRSQTQIQTHPNGHLTGGSLQSSTAPTTRAVDRAQNSPYQNNRIDLSAIRLQEAE